MESEVHEFAAALGAPTGEKPGSVACEDVLLPSDSVSTNGISSLNAAEDINFLEEREDSADENDKEEFIVEVPEDEEEDDLDAEADADAEAAEEEQEEEEEQEDDEEEIDGDTENAAQQKECAQLPKKRKFAPASAEGNADAAIGDDGEEDEEDDNEEEQEEDDEEQEEVDEIDEDLKMEAAELMQDEMPTSSARAAANKENTVDEEICRVCTTKENLVSLFKRIETQTVAEMLMVICPAVSIARKDFMPQYICQPCLDNVSIAIQLKMQCESTERELRKKLSRHKNKVRRPSGYVVIDAPVESDPDEEEEEPADDVEFKVSDVEISASADESDTDDSDFGSSKKKRFGRGGGAGGKRGRRKSSVSISGPKEKKRMGRPPKRSAQSSDEEGIIEKKKRDNLSADSQSNEFACDECDQVFARKLSLVLHKKAHAQTPPITCKLCGKNFKIKGAYRTHLERHKADTTQYNCSKCDLWFTTKAELKKHQVDEHEEYKEGTLYCQHCKRSFVSEQRLKRHLEHYCPNNQSMQKHRRSDIDSYPTGKDLFKTVAPLTTTYWSDSFSD